MRRKDQVTQLENIGFFRLPPLPVRDVRRPKLPFCLVPGNCDGWGAAVPVKKQINLAGKSILLSHGHRWGVKSGYDTAIADARAVGADILLFGHTHIPLCRQLEDGLWMMNPGPARSSYGLI